MSTPRMIVPTVECDFPGYQPYDGGCTYDHAQCIESIKSAIDLIRSAANGKAVFLAHTSPFIRRQCGDPFYTGQDYLALWHAVQDMGGEVGLHPHEEEPDGSAFYYYYSKHMRKVLSEHADLLRRQGIVVTSQMMGYSGMNEWITPIVEELGITVSLNNTGTYMHYSHNDWCKSPMEPYFHSYDGISQPGTSKVLEIPLGGTDLLTYEDGLVIDTNSLSDLKRLWKRMREERINTPCFLLIRTQNLSGCSKTAEGFLKFSQENGAVLATPSEVYRSYTSNNSGLER